MTTPTKEQIDIILNSVRNVLLQSGNIFDWKWEVVVLTVIAEWEKIKKEKRWRLEVGKTYIAKDGSEVKIIYKSPIRCTGFLGIRATDGKTHPDDAIWYNPDGSHNEKYDELTIICPK